LPKITYHHDDGTQDVLDVADGSTVMRSAVTSGVHGIVGECGGQAMCATCHVYVREPDLAALPEISEEEEEMLECAAAERDETRSRLGCQLTLGGQLPELEVDVPKAQV